MSYKELVKEIESRCKGLEVKDESSLISEFKGVITVFYDSMDILHQEYRLSDSKDAERAYEKLFYDLVESGIRYLAEIAGFLTQTSPRKG